MYPVWLRLRVGCQFRYGRADWGRFGPRMDANRRRRWFVCPSLLLLEGLSDFHRSVTCAQSATIMFSCMILSLVRLKRNLSMILVSLAVLGGPRLYADDENGSGHVLLISIDGMHAVDFQNCAHGISGFHGGSSYCPNLAALASTGVNFTAASTSKPSDSFPGIVALVAGASPHSAGVYYDVSYTRELAPPSGPCVVGVAGPGTDIVYDETLDFNLNDLTGGGGINPANLPRDPMHGCMQVYPRNF